MASKREIKKEVNFLFEEMIADAILIREIKKGDTQQKTVESLIMKSVDKHEDLIVRINHNETRDDKQSSKQYYSTIAKEAIDFFDDVYKQLNDIIQVK